MKEAFANGCGMSFSVGRFRGKRPFYKEVTITNALRSQFDYEGYGKLSEGNPTIGMRVIEGRGR
jgi:hypothetical protein